MGIDATVLFRMARADLEPDLEDFLPSEWEVIPVSRYLLEYLEIDATHEVDSLRRYYGIGYERGPWPEICGVLMALHATKGVEMVWYGGDQSVYECPVEAVLEISRHYMQHGHRPYR